jgi:hypothetical protein
LRCQGEKCTLRFFQTKPSKPIEDNDADQFRSYFHITSPNSTSLSGSWIHLGKRRGGDGSFGQPSGAVTFQARSENGAFGTIASLDDGAALPKNKWLHLVGMYDVVQHSIRLYINGVLQSSASLNELSLTNNNYYIWIGYYAVGSPSVESANGNADDVRIDNRALSSDAVTALYNTATAVLPSIASQPLSRTNMAGTTATFSVTASGTAPLSYQWRKNGVNLSNGGSVSGVNTPTLALANVQTADAGSYSVVISNVAGTVTSQVAVLSITIE